MPTTQTDTLTPAPDNLFGNTGVSYNAAQLITMACHAIANTTFTALDPKPAWYDNLNAQLLAAQQLAQQWLDTLGIQVTKTIPLQVINFGSNFTAATNEIIKIAQEHPDATGADNPYVVEIKQIIEQTLLPPIKDVITQMGSVSTSLADWGSKMQKAHNDLKNGAANIQAAEIALGADIDNMNNAISTLKAAIDAENKAIAYSAGAIAIGVFALVVGIALAPETGGASLWIGGAIGAAGIIGGSVTWGVMQHKIDGQFGDIAKDQERLANDQRQIVALQGLQMATDNAVNSIELATSSLSKLETQWGIFQGELQGVVNKLESADKSLSAIVAKVFTSAAQTEWVSAIETANSLVNKKITIDAKTLPMNSGQAA